MMNTEHSPKADEFKKGDHEATMMADYRLKYAQNLIKHNWQIPEERSKGVDSFTTTLEPLMHYS